MAGERSGAGTARERCPGLHLAAAVFLLGGDAIYAPVAPASRPGRKRPPHCYAMGPRLDTRSFHVASQRKQENQKLQRPAA